jgi:hypothetical protein
MVMVAVKILKYQTRRQIDIVGNVEKNPWNSRTTTKASRLVIVDE